jgi:hypothetical protein
MRVEFDTEGQHTRDSTHTSLVDEWMGGMSANGLRGACGWNETYCTATMMCDDGDRGRCEKENGAPSGTVH